jgi:histidinol-phosphate phosphatase family protein
MPKPMIPFHGKPFLEYLIEMLRGQGFDRILMLLGYLPNAITNYFGDGSRWDVRIEYAITDPEEDTGRRLKLAQDRVDPVFLLVYCDNYWPMDFAQLWKQYDTGAVPAQLVVYRNADQYTRDNTLVGSDGIVVGYDRSRQSPGLQGVDIGFAILRNELLDLLPNENVSFEQTVYPQLVNQRQLGAFLTSHRYYSVGSPDRLALTSEFLSRKPAVILDRDGVLNKKMPRAEYVRSWADWEWIPGSLDAVAMFRQAGYRVIVVSNQAGIARGIVSMDALSEIHEKMTTQIREKGGDIDAIYVCPHGWDDGCDCRKPKPGMLFAAQREFCLDLSRTPFIGDDERDRDAAQAAGCPALTVSGDVNLIDHARQMLAS